MTGKRCVNHAFIFRRLAAPVDGRGGFREGNNSDYGSGYAGRSARAKMEGAGDVEKKMGGKEMTGRSRRSAFWRPEVERDALDRRFRVDEAGEQPLQVFDAVDEIDH